MDKKRLVEVRSKLERRKSGKIELYEGKIEIYRIVEENWKMEKKFRTKKCNIRR